MANVESVKAHLLSLHGGDLESAFDNAVRSYLYILAHASKGAARINPYEHTMPPKPPAPAIVIKSEE